MKKEKFWKKIQGKVVSIRGTFDKKDMGHLGMWSGSIKDVSDIYSEASHIYLKDNNGN